MDATVTILAVILACCGVIILLLLFLLFRPAASGAEKAELDRVNASCENLGRELALLRESSAGENRQLMDQATRQSETTVNQVMKLGDGLRDSLHQQQEKTDASLEKFRGDMDGFRRDTGEQVREINRVVTEKMQEILDRKINEAFESVAKNVANLGRGLNEGQAQQQKSTEERLDALKGEFEKIRTAVQEGLDNIRTENVGSLEKLRKDNQESLNQINQTVNEKLQKTLNDRITQSFELVNKRLTEVYEGLGEMKKVASGVSDLKNVLSNVKNRGIMGEIQLSVILGDILAPEQYEEQFRINPASAEAVDFAVKLPGQEDGDFVYLPIDSKFPGDTYAALAAAYDTGSSAEIKQKRAALEQEIKRCAKSIHSKYIVPPHSTDFAILFLPFEGLYAEVVNMGLVEVLQRDYRVNITGPSTMAAMLNSLQMGFRTLAIQKKSGEVWKILEAAKKEFNNFETVLTKTRDRLRQADEELDKLIGTRTKAINRKLRAVSSLGDSEDSAEILELT